MSEDLKPGDFVTKTVQLVRPIGRRPRKGDLIKDGALSQQTFEFLPAPKRDEQIHGIGGESVAISDVHQFVGPQELRRERDECPPR